MKRYDRYLRNLTHDRIKLCLIISLILFLGLQTRLYLVQIYDNDHLKLQALKQRSVEISLNSQRGNIYDRNLIPLTNSEIEKNLLVPKETILKNEELLNKIEEATSLSYGEIWNYLNDNDDLLQIPINKDIELDGINNAIVVDVINRYSESNILSHVIGYINKAENRGEYGIEKVYDEFLNKSDKSSVFIEYDEKRTMVLGMSQYVDNYIASEDPAGVKLTIDYNIQNVVEKILDESRETGAVIVADVDTAEILALASRPNFNQEKMEEYFHRDDMALYNKGIQVSYPPGSIYKIVVLLAALEEDIGLLNREYYCKGYEEISNTIIKCNNTNGHGFISLKEGFAKSCNSVFIQIGKEIGARKIIEMSKRLGLGEKTNIGLLEEVEGSLPEGDELLGPVIGNISIGQDKIETTPLQITNLILTIANNGIRKDMTIIKGITTKDGNMIKEYNKMPDHRVIDEELSIITNEYLKEVTNSGTARGINLDDFGGAAGKTGSAEASFNGEYTIHGWFAGYYPKDNPQYAITVLVEDADSGSQSAVPIFEDICKELYKINH